MSGKRTFGIATYNYSPRDMLDLATHADRLGFDTFWFGEHYVLPKHYVGHHPSRKEVPNNQNDERDKAILGEHVRIYDPWFVLGAVAGATKHIRLGTAICIVPMNQPLLLARHTVTAHDMSDGRFLLGTGAGWLKEEFDAVGIPFNERGSRLDETIEILKQAWQGGYFEHHGKHFNFESLQISPHPVKVPLICGGNTGPALRRVGRVADGWINSASVELDEALQARDVVEKERQAQGTAGRPFEYFIRPPAPDPALVETYLRAGFENIVLTGNQLWPITGDLTLEQKVAGLERAARDLGVSAPAVEHA